MMHDGLVCNTRRELLRNFWRVAIKLIPYCLVEMELSKLNSCAFFSAVSLHRPTYTLSSARLQNNAREDLFLSFTGRSRDCHALFFTLWRLTRSTSLSKYLFP
jgi:hypothetical protein